MRLIETFQEQSADFVQTVELDGIFVSIRIVFNVRTESWYINEYREIDTDKKIFGVKIINDFPLFLSMKNIIDLPGDFLVIKEDESLNLSIDYDNFNNGYNLYYLTFDEVRAWRTKNGV